MDYSILKEQISDDIKKNAKSSTKALQKMIQEKTANYQTAAEYSKVLGDSVSKSIASNITGSIPDDELAQFATECLAPIYRQSQDTMLSACKSIQKLYNAQAGINLNPADVARDESRIEHIVERFEEASKYEEVKFLTGSNVTRSITRGAVQDSIKTNSKMQSDTGLKIRISRSDGSGCCDWCSSVVGTFDSFEALPDGFWGIHRGCNCVIDYRVGNTRNKISFNTDEKGNLSKITEEIQDDSFNNSNTSDIIKPTKIIDGHKGTPKASSPNDIIDHTDKNGVVDARSFYDKDGLKEKDIHTTNHGNPKWHSYGNNGEHGHDYEWNEDGTLKEKTTRELTEKERKENGDIL